MPTVRPLSSKDVDEIRRIAGIYLSDLELRENEEMFHNGCKDSSNRTFGYASQDSNSLIGFILGTIKTQNESLDEHFNRPTPVSAEAKSVILQHLYVVPENWGQGVGTRLLNAAMDEVDSLDIEEVYAEAWIDPETPDAVPLLENKGFEEIYHSTDYWAHDGFVASSVPCPTHDRSYSECPCEGAVYKKEVK